MNDSTVDTHPIPGIDLFVHIPKTAGTTLREVLNRNYAPETIFDLGPNVQPRIAEFQAYSAAEQRPFRLVVGHLSYGMHDHLKEQRPYRYFTMLRDPVERVLSFYYFIKRNEEHYLHQALVEGGMSVTDYLQLENAVMVRNGQTRFLCGIEVNPYFGPVDEQALEMAKTNLRDNIAVVGLTEQFDESLQLLRHILGWHALHYQNRNVTADRPQQHDLPEADLAAIRAHNALDMELYAFAQELFAERYAEHAPHFRPLPPPSVPEPPDRSLTARLRDVWQRLAG